MSDLNARGARAMRALNRLGVKKVELADAFQVHPSTASRVVSGISQSHPAPPDSQTLTDREAAAVRVLKSKYSRITLAMFQDIFLLPTSYPIRKALQG